MAKTTPIHSYPGEQAKTAVDDAVRKFRQAYDLMQCAEYADTELNKAVVALPPGTLSAYLARTEQIRREAR